MARTPCESSLRPDWISVSFKSASERHQQQVWEMAQTHVGRITEDLDWEVNSASRHFERCMRHPIGVRFETASQTAERNAGLSVITFSGLYFALSSVYEQMRLIQHLNSFKGRYHWTRLDCQVTTLNPTQSAEQICKDIQERRLWIKGYQGWEPKGLKDADGNAINGLSACFGAAVSDRSATSYNKGAEQTWPTPARRDEVRLRGSWAEQHMDLIATAIAGASSENEAVDAYQSACASTIKQHMQYLDITGTPIPKPKDWARGKEAPQWWNETLEQEIQPVKLNRRPIKDVWDRFAHMRMQWSPTWAEACAELVAAGHADSVQQASFDLAQRMLAGLKPEHFERVTAGIAEHQRERFVKELMDAADAAAVHAEVIDQ